MQELINELFTLNNYQLEQVYKYIEELKHPKEIKKLGLNANNYMWQLIQKIADKIGSTKEEVYLEAIRDKGQFEIVPVKNEAVEQFIKCWSKNGLGNVCEIKGESKINGYTNIICYFGSSTYDTKQFSYLCDYIVEQAKELEIETLTTNEILEMGLI